MLGLLLGLARGLRPGAAGPAAADRRPTSATGPGSPCWPRWTTRTTPHFDDVLQPYGPGGRIFNRLRNEVLASLSPGDQIIVVTGASRGSASTLVAANLAAALARTGSDVVLIGAHLPDSVVDAAPLARMLGVAAMPGLSDLLAGRVGLAEAMQRSAAHPVAAGDHHRRRGHRGRADAVAAAARHPRGAAPAGRVRGHRGAVDQQQRRRAEPGQPGRRGDPRGRAAPSRGARPCWTRPSSCAGSAPRCSAPWCCRGCAGAARRRRRRRPAVALAAPPSRSAVARSPGAGRDGGPLPRTTDQTQRDAHPRPTPSSRPAPRQGHAARRQRSTSPTAVIELARPGAAREALTARATAEVTLVVSGGAAATARTARPRARRRPAEAAERLPGLAARRRCWPLYPLWWALGLGVLIFPLAGRADGWCCCCAAARPAARCGCRPASRWWPLFLVAVVVSIAALGADPAGTVAGHVGDRLLAARATGSAMYAVADRAAALRRQPDRGRAAPAPAGPAARLAVRGDRRRRAARHGRRARSSSPRRSSCCCRRACATRASCSRWCTRTPRRSWTSSAATSPARPRRGATPTPGATTSACWSAGSWWRPGRPRRPAPKLFAAGSAWRSRSCPAVHLAQPRPVDRPRRAGRLRRRSGYVLLGRLWVIGALVAAAGAALAVALVATPLGDVVGARLDNGKSNGVRSFLIERALDGLRRVAGDRLRLHPHHDRRPQLDHRRRERRLRALRQLHRRRQRPALAAAVRARRWSGTVGYLGFFGYGLWRFRRDRSADRHRRRAPRSSPRSPRCSGTTRWSPRWPSCSWPTRCSGATTLEGGTT